MLAPSMAAAAIRLIGLGVLGVIRFSSTVTELVV